nr:MAG TPA: hypothetical protein [Caudoviricetes sp.]DAL44434.1 MAG TPA_asm: hypothetical protein [Bacteriophage sp.]DAL74315.1 MAG TPA: hypothetical protein [Caudoviricetes sp.]DAT98209.1 MAG TPA: hypothetical protein [Caudoviricetes sp.]
MPACTIPYAKFVLCKILSTLGIFFSLLIIIEHLFYSSNMCYHQIVVAFFYTLIDCSLRKEQIIGLCL